LKSENSIETKPENIIVTPGAKQASMIALMAILEPHDKVINKVFNFNARNLPPAYLNHGLNVRAD
jgi:aspartate/methionine/tyrosine aminotransferase